MSYQTPEFAHRWKDMNLLEQMTNIGSEVDRAIHWKSKNNASRCEKSAERALELLDLSLQSSMEFPRLKEIARVREALADFFFGSNEYGSSDLSWQRYFLYFGLAFRKHL